MFFNRWLINFARKSVKKHKEDLRNSINNTEESYLKVFWYAWLTLLGRTNRTKAIVWSAIKVESTKHSKRLHFFFTLRECQKWVCTSRLYQWPPSNSTRITLNRNVTCLTDHHAWWWWRVCLPVCQQAYPLEVYIIPMPVQLLWMLRFYVLDSEIVVIQDGLSSPGSRSTF